MRRLEARVLMALWRDIWFDLVAGQSLTLQAYTWLFLLTLGTATTPS